MRLASANHRYMGITITTTITITIIITITINIATTITIAAYISILVTVQIVLEYFKQHFSSKEEGVKRS